MAARECGFETCGYIFTSPNSSWSHFFCSLKGERSWLTKLSKLMIDGIFPLVSQDLQVDGLKVLQRSAVFVLFSHEATSGFVKMK